MQDWKIGVVRPPTVRAQSVARLALHVEFAWRHGRDEADRWGFDLAAGRCYIGVRYGLSRYGKDLPP